MRLGEGRIGTLVVGMSVVVLALSVGCSKSRRNGNGTTGSSTTGGSQTGGPHTNGNGNGNGNGTGTPGGATVNPADVVTAIAPDRGLPSGGTLVTVEGMGYAPGTLVFFGGIAATDVNVLTANTLECLTPPHAAGVVDVEVELASGTRGRLNNAFTYDPNAGGPLARVADYGDPTGAEQELLELMNEARRDPTATGVRLGLDFSMYQARPALTHNEFLADASLRHTVDMVQRAFYGHMNPDGDNANGRLLDTQFDLHTSFGSDRTVNFSESVGAGSGNLFNTPQKVIDAFLRDEGVNPPKHRESILGHGGHLPFNREVGNAFRINQQSAQTFTHFATLQFARSNRDRPFVTGVVFQDASGDGICREGEGEAGVTVTLSHASGFQITTQTASGGGYAFEVFVDEDFTLEIGGQQTQVQVQGETIKVDLRDGQLVAH